MVSQALGTGDAFVVRRGRSVVADWVFAVVAVSDDWWKGEKIGAGTQGIFPVAYVQMQ